MTLNRLYQFLFIRFNKKKTMALSFFGPPFPLNSINFRDNTWRHTNAIDKHCSFSFYLKNKKRWCVKIGTFQFVFFSSQLRICIFSARKLNVWLLIRGHQSHCNFSLRLFSDLLRYQIACRKISLEYEPRKYLLFNQCKRYIETLNICKANIVKWRKCILEGHAWT